MPFKYLQDDVYYGDLYDRFTVKQGRVIEIRHKKELKIDPDHKAIKKMVQELFMYYFKGNRYKNKSDTVNAWKNEDSRKDKLIEEAEPLPNIHCLNCNGVMECSDKELIDHDGQERILFTYDCPHCKSHRAFYDNGKEYRVGKTRCQKCQSTNIQKKVQKKPHLILTIVCKDCSNKDRIDFSTSREKPDPYFIKDRDKFCLTDEEGQKYLQDLVDHEALGRLMKEIDERDKAWVEKLEKHPEGFHLFDGEGYTCPICHNSMSGTETWFDQYGQKCMRCKTNIDQGIIPAWLSVFERRKDWLDEYSLKDKTGLTIGKIRKAIRLGNLKARELVDADDHIYGRIFLISENLSFLNSHSQILEHSIK